MKRVTILLIFVLIGATRLAAQETDCTHLGQNPGSAFPVCGTVEFHQEDVPVCGKRTLPSPCNDPLISNKNPFWYKFTCYKSGSLGFLITPVDENDDYDWQLYDITGHSPNDVYTNKDMIIACNWSGRTGVTGATLNGASLVECVGSNAEIFSAMPPLVAGHEYLLLISHWTDSQSGYSLSFTGGSADITDPKTALPEKVTGSCKGNEVYLKLNKKMKCSSLAADGSDFSILAGGAAIIGARSGSCDNDFNTDSIVVQLNSPLPAGNYSMNIKKGGDQNTLLDNCDVEMAPAQVNFAIYEDVSAEFKYELKTGCDSDTIFYLHDGGNNVNQWIWNFGDGEATTQNPVIIYSSFGTRNAELIVSNGHCYDTASTTFVLPQKIMAAFNAPAIICAADPAPFSNSSLGEIVSFRWNFGNGATSTLRDPEPVKYPATNGEKSYVVELEVADAAGCKRVATANVVVVGNCNIAVPSAFTPNGDGRNDQLYPSNAFNADKLAFRVYNRFGRVMFETRDWTQKWDGKVNGQPQPSGTYIWTLSYQLKATGKPYYLKGTVVLIR